MPKHFNKIPKNSHPALWDKAQLINLYVTQEFGTFKIAQMLGASHSSVDRALKRAGIQYHHLKHFQGEAKEKSYNGYKYIWNGAKYKAVHRLKIEELLGRKLSTNEHIHHINGIKDDNRLQNLRVLSAKEHRIASLQNLVCKDCPYKQNNLIDK